MGNRTDFSLFVPDWMLESERFLEFLQMMESIVDDALDDIDEIAYLEKPDYLVTEDEWTSEFLRQLGMGFGFEKEKILLLSKLAGEVIRRIGIYDAFRFLLKQVYGSGVQLDDNFSQVMILSENGTLSGSYVQDGKYWRDGSYTLWIPQSLLNQVEIFKKWFPVGVFLWLFLIGGIFGFEDRSLIKEFDVKSGIAFRLTDRDNFRICFQSIMDMTSQDNNEMYYNFTSYIGLVTNNIIAA